MSAWGHVCRLSRIMRYHSPTVWAQHDVTGFSAFAQATCCPTQPFSTLHFGCKWSSSLPRVFRCATPHSWKPFGEGQNWPTDHSWAPVKKYLAEVQSLLLRVAQQCSTLRFWSGVSNVVGPEYLESVTGWKTTILVANMII